MAVNSKNDDGKKVLTFGVFDLLHWGHFELFRRAQALGGPNGKLIIALQWDEWVTKYKDVKLVYDFETRKKMIETLRTVYKVEGYDAVGVPVLERIDFDILAVGPEHTSERFQQCFKWCEEHGKEVVVLPRTDGISTTRLKEIIKEL